MAGQWNQDWNGEDHVLFEDTYYPWGISSDIEDGIAASTDDVGSPHDPFDLSQADHDEESAASMPFEEATSATINADYNSMGMSLEYNTTFSFDGEFELERQSMGHESVVVRRPQSPVAEPLRHRVQNFQHNTDDLSDHIIPNNTRVTSLEGRGDFRATEDFVAVSQFGTSHMSLDGTGTFLAGPDMMPDIGSEEMMFKHSDSRHEVSRLSERRTLWNTWPSASLETIMHNPTNTRFDRYPNSSINGMVALAPLHEEPWSIMNPRYVAPQNGSRTSNAVPLHPAEVLGVVSGTDAYDNINSYSLCDVDLGTSLSPLLSGGSHTAASWHNVCAIGAQDDFQQGTVEDVSDTANNNPNTATPHLPQINPRPTIRFEPYLSQERIPFSSSIVLNSLLSPKNPGESNFLSVPESEDLHSEHSNASVSQCAVCGKEYHGKYGRGNCSRHVRLKHRDPVPMVYCCEELSCNSTFNRQDARLKHYKKHHPHLAIRSAHPRRPSNTQTSGGSRASSLGGSG